MEKAINFITIGYAKQALTLGSREHERMKGYADKISSLHIIVFTRTSENFKEPLYDGKLTVHPTNSVVRPLMLLDALVIGFKLLKQAPPDTWVISSQDPFETSLVGRVLSLVAGVRHHVQLHGDNFSGGTWRGESLFNWIRYWFGLYILRSAVCIRVASFRIKRSLEVHGVAKERITVLPIRPEIERFFDTPHTVREHGPFTFLVSSRFSQEKNIPLIIRAFYTIHKEFPHAQLRLVGAGPEAGTIQALLESLDLHSFVTMHPWSATIEREMQQADAFLMASNHESYGLTLIEALAVGLPIITTDVGCVGEVIRADVHGLVVPVGDENAFTDAMRRMIMDYAFRVRVSGAERSTAEMLRAVSPNTYNEEWVASVLCNTEAV